MPAHFHDIVPVLIVDTVEPTRTFLRDRLGFTVEADVPHNNALGFSMLKRGDVTIMVQSDASLRADVGESYVGGPYKAALYVTVDNVDLLVPEVADADITLPLRHTAYGMHEIGVREPGGNIIVFASRQAD